MYETGEICFPMDNDNTENIFKDMSFKYDAFYREFFCKNT